MLETRDSPSLIAQRGHGIDSSSRHARVPSRPQMQLLPTPGSLRKWPCPPEIAKARKYSVFKEPQRPEYSARIQIIVSTRAHPVAAARGTESALWPQSMWRLSGKQKHNVVSLLACKSLIILRRHEKFLKMLCFVVYCCVLLTFFHLKSAIKRLLETAIFMPRCTVFIVQLLFAHDMRTVYIIFCVLSIGIADCNTFSRI